MEADRIFNVFTRLHSNIAYKGTGLGLSIVRRVLQNHNGYVTAKGAVGQGAVFALFLPE
jgi:signal transduction histidine kinase